MMNKKEYFFNEMSRFIPLEIQQRTLNKSKFIDFLMSENSRMLLEVKNIIDGGVSNEL